MMDGHNVCYKLGKLGNHFVPEKVFHYDNSNNLLNFVSTSVVQIDKNKIEYPDR